MSRSRYIEDCEYTWDQIKYRGAVESAICGQRGQDLFVDLLQALDSLPEKSLITEELVNSDGAYCALGVLAKMKDIDVTQVDPTDEKMVADLFNIAPCLAREIVFMNDEYFNDVTPYHRWLMMRAWVKAQIAI